MSGKHSISPSCTYKADNNNQHDNLCILPPHCTLNIECLRQWSQSFFLCIPWAECFFSWKRMLADSDYLSCRPIAQYAHLFLILFQYYEPWHLLLVQFLHELASIDLHLGYLNSIPEVNEYTRMTPPSLFFKLFFFLLPFAFR